MALLLLVTCFPSFHKWVTATSIVKFVFHIGSGLFSTTIHILPQDPNKHPLMHEHSLSKCHVEAVSFWSKERVPVATVRPPVRKVEGKKEKRISDYFAKVSDPLN